ncbi:MAG: hypothetical protein ABIH48_01920 [Candidatus Falkowbacteria bacterium]
MIGKKSPVEKLLKKLTTADIALIKLSALCLGIFVALYFPQIAEVDPVYYLGAAIVFAIKPLTLYFEK